MTPVPFSADITSAVTSEDSVERVQSSSKQKVEAVIHVDLSVTTNVELLSRLAPLMQQLKLEEISKGDASNNSHDASSPGSPASPYPEINLRLTYHIFNMQAEPSSARHCLTGEMGQFCAFPPADEESLGGSVVVEESLLQLCLADYLKNNSHARLLTDAGEGEARPQIFPEVVFWRYLQEWCRHCSHIEAPSAQATGNGDAKAEERGTGNSKNNTIQSGIVAELQFQRVCSQRQLASLHVSLSNIAEACGDLAGPLLQQQIESVFPVVPTLVINGQILYDEHVWKGGALYWPPKLINVPGSNADYAHMPTILSSTSSSADDMRNGEVQDLDLYDYAVHSSSPSLIFDETDSASENGSFAVAEHLLKTFGQTEEGREGQYRVKNELAVEILRRQKNKKPFGGSMLPKSTLPSGEAASVEIGERRSAHEYNYMGLAPPPGDVDGISSPSEEATSGESGASSKSNINSQAGLDNDLLLFPKTSWYGFSFGFWVTLIILFLIVVFVSVFKIKKKRRLLQRRGDVAAEHEE